MSDVVQKLWGFCHTLRHDGIDLTGMRMQGLDGKTVKVDCAWPKLAGDLHTVLRLPNGTFTPYSPGTKTNVVFFTKGFATQTVWVYDARSNVPGITKKDRPLSAEHFREFEACYGKDPNGRAKRDANHSPAGSGYCGGNRWRSFHISQVKERDYKIDSLKWLKDDSLDNGGDLPEPEELATEAIGELEAAVVELNGIVALLENGK